jgi:hypothetical protein
MGPGLLINKIRDVLEKKFNYAATSMESTSTKLWRCKLRKNCLKGSGNWGEVDPEKQARMEGDGWTFDLESDNPTMTTPGGETLTSNDFESGGTVETNPQQGAALDTVFDSDYFATNGPGAENAAAATGTSHAPPLVGGVGNDEEGHNLTIREQINEDGTVKEGVSASNIGDEVDNASTRASPDTPSGSGVHANSDGVLAEAEANSRSQSDEAVNIEDSGPSKTAQAVKGAVAVLEYACSIYTVLHGIDVALKVTKAIILARYAMIFLSTADAIRAGEATPEQVSQLGGIITTVLVANATTSKHKKGDVVTKSGTDSFGYGLASGMMDMTKNGGISTNIGGGKPGDPSENTMKYITSGLGGFGASAPWAQAYVTVTSVINRLNDVIGAGTGIQQACAATQSTTFQVTESVTNLALNIASCVGTACVATVAKFVVEGVLWTAGGMVVGKLLSQVIQNFVDSAAGKMFEKVPLGEDAMDANTGGTGALLGFSARGSGDMPLDQGQAVSYLNEMKDHTLRQATIARATRSPFDITSNDTFLGSIVGNFAATMYSNGASLKGFAASLLGMFGSSLSTIVRGLPANATAETLEYLNACEDPEIQNAGIAVDPFCNPIYGTLSRNIMDPEDVKSQIASEVDSSGNPTSDGLKGFMKNCVDRAIDRPMGTSDDSGDNGSQCKIDVGKNKLYANYVKYSQVYEGMSGGFESCMSATSCRGSSAVVAPSGPVDGGQVTMIGDSITVGSAAQIRQKLSGVKIYAQSSKGFDGSNSSNPSGQQILENPSLVGTSPVSDGGKVYDAPFELRNVVVVALGTNTDNLTIERIQNMVTTIGAGKTIYFVNNYDKANAQRYQANNQAFAAVAQTNPNVKVIDWAGAASADPEKYISTDPDGLTVHPTGEGRTLLANIIATALGGSP